ncbi:MAG TPA: alkaline phosphatase family protein [Longimicrobiales bacterium]|nr:alkaline phosphatase family protein [Longimicrobiales bacterium]
MDPRTRRRSLLRSIHRIYFRIKYFPFARERRQRREDGRRGFIAIQIDALAHEDLERALRLGYVPNLKRLIEQEGWELRRFPAGLPSATPAAQAAIFYGTKDAIPAFRFYEKSERRVIIGSQPASMQAIRDRLPADGVLENGSSYVNLYDGGAARVAFTLSAQRRQPLFEKMGGTRLLLLLALHPIRVLRMVLASVWEYLREERDRLVSHARGRYTHYWWYIPLLHIGAGVVLRELQTLAVLLDIYTGVPAIYTTYNVYDEFAHHIGPSSNTALKGLRALDRRIGEILRMRARLPGRPYDVFILSDHGQTPAVPYRVKYGETLGDTVVNAVQHGVFVLASTGEFAPAGETVAMLLRELEEVGATSPRPGRRVGIRFTRWIRRHYRIFPLVPETVRVSDDDKLVVTYSSSLAHLYWTEPEHPLSLDEIRANPEFRALYYFLVAHRGIGPVITRLLDAAHVEDAFGRALVTPDGEIEVLEGEDPLAGYASTDVERRAIVDLVRMPNAGDLILFGAYDPETDTCVCFDDQVGAHGALGGRQFWPFLLTEPGIMPDGMEIRDPLDLYPVFDRYRRGVA